MSDPDDALNWMFIVLGALLLLAIVGMVGSCTQSMKEFKALEAAGCRKVSERDTGRRIYCGKACFRRETETTYACTVEPLTRVRVY